MKIGKKLAALIGAGALVLGVTGVALAYSGPATVTWVDGKNIHLGPAPEDPNKNQDYAVCTEANGFEDGPEGEFDDGDVYEVDGVSVTVHYDSETKEVSFEATGGLVTDAYIKGGNGYNHYAYDPGVSADEGLVAPDNGSEGPAGLSHFVICVGEGSQSNPPSNPASFTSSQQAETQCNCDADLTGTNKTSSPSDASWLLVVAMGVLLASAVVLTPARMRNRR